MPIILDFVALLRYFGLPISPAETIEAQQAYSLVGVEDPNELRFALKACLVKRHEDVTIFNTAYNFFFSGVSSDKKEEQFINESNLQEIQRFKEGKSKFLQRLSSTDPLYGKIGQLLVENRIDEAIKVVNLQSGDSTSNGFGGMMGAGFSEDQLNHLVKSIQRSFRVSFNIPIPIRGMTAEQREKVTKSVLELAANLFKFVDSLNNIDKGLIETVPETMSKKEQFLDYNLNYISITISNVKNQLMEIGRILASRERRKRERFNKGRMDFRRTFRKNLSHGGAPIHLVFRRKKKQDPEIVILNDVSGSTQWVSTWFFVICYAARSVFRKIRIYEFDNTTVDVTSALEVKTIDRALAKRIECWEKTLRPRRIHSDYQTSLEDLLCLTKYKPINNKTSVLMLGDCRDNEGNWRQSGPISAELIKKIITKAKRFIILNPESKSLWDTGDSVVAYYRKAGAEIHHVSNFRELTRLVFELK